MIPQRKLGPYEVSAIGLGCMHLSIPNKRNPNLVNEPDQAIAVIEREL